MPERFKKALAFSVAIHLLIIGMIWLDPAFHFKWKKPTKVTWLKLSQGDGGTNTKANHKNLDTLPDATIREQKEVLKELMKGKKGNDRLTRDAKTKNPDTKTEKIVTQQKVSDKGGINIDKKTPTKTPTRIDDALARIDQQLEQREIQIGASQAKKEDTGQSPFGTAEGDAIDPALITYYNAIKQKINKEWIVSKGEFTGTLKTQIVVLIDGGGNILRTEYEKQSGDVSFDESALRALKRAAPFPVPPDTIRAEALTEGFLIEFNPRTVTGRL